MLRSMTGYGTGESSLGQGRLVVEIRAVNHRYLDARVRLPSGVADQSPVAEDIVRARLERGRVEVSGRLQGEALAAPELDRERARAAFEQLCALRDELRPDEPVPLSLLSSVPELFTTHAAPPSEQAERAVREATEAACEAVGRMRCREGEALAAHLDTHLQQLEQQLERLQQRSSNVVEEHRHRLHERIGRLLRNTDVELDAARLEHEVALLADRADVDEELARLSSHCAQFRELIRRPEGAVGRRMDFLLQEMARETNTIGAKSSDGETTRVVVDIKAEVEKMREQAQNVV